MTRKAGLLGLAMLTAIGCGEAIDINRVAPNYQSKEIFKGEWYQRATLVDKQFATDVGFIGQEGPLERISWEITETTLIARRSYERVPGSEPSNPGEQSVIAMFPIQRHFDIRRQYNPTNGVETNVIEENDYDRPWWEREFIRVDWSRQMADTFDVGEFTFAGSSQVGVNRNAGNDPTDPWRVRVSSDYIETTLDGFASPDPYICYYLDGLSPCNAASVKVKMSFKKINAQSDYQPLDDPDYVPVTIGALTDAATGNPIFTSTANEVIARGGQAPQRQCTASEVGPDGTGPFLVKDEPGLGLRLCNTDPALGDDLAACTEIIGRCDAQVEWFAAGPENRNVPCDASIHDPDDCFQLTTPMFSRFGYFRTDRYQLDRENGFQYNARERLINRWNVWHQSVDGETGKVIPMALRAVKPVVYHLNASFPASLAPSVAVLESEWDIAFKSMLASVRGVSLTELPQNLNQGIEGAPVVEKLFVLKQNDCNLDHVNSFAGEHDLGDALRASGIVDIGLGNLENACAVLEHESQKRAATGEDIPVFTWQQLGDLRYSFVNWTSKAELAGPLGYGPSAADPVTGEIVSANANIYGASLDTYSNWGADIVQLLNGEISLGDIINGTVAREHVEGVRNRWAQRLPKSQVDAFIGTFDRRTSHMSDDDYYVQLPATALNGGLRKLRASGLEEQFLMTTETLRLFGNDPQALRDGVISDRMRENARPSTWAHKAVPTEMLTAANASAADFDFMKRNQTPSAAGRMDDIADYLGRKNYCYLAQQVEPAVVDLANEIRDAGMTREEMVDFIRNQVFIAVTLHEIGHTLGLRHNFEGSADAMNFFPQYWGLSRDSMSEDHQHLFGLTDRPKEVQYSSIMDYLQRFNVDFAGLGLYDKAAIKFGYGEMVETFDERVEEFVARDWIDSTFLLDPQDIPVLVGGADANVKLNREFSDTYLSALEGDEFAQLDFRNNAGVTPQFANIYKRKDIPLKAWLRNEMLRNFVGTLDDSACGNFNGAGTGPGCMRTFLQDAGYTDDDGSLPKVSVPYSFCSDAFAFGGNLTCNRYDMGTTSREIVKNAGEMYEFYYPFDAFRRERALNPFVPWTSSYMSRLYSRTYQPMLNAYRYFYYYRRSQTLRIYPTIRDWGEAALTGMNFFVRVLQQPEPGTYCKDGTTWVPEAKATSGCAESVDVGLDQGRIYNSNWDSEYDFRPINIGHYWDKALAIQAMTDSDAFFFRDFSSFTNRGAFSIGYYRVFQNEMMDLFGDLMLSKTEHFAPHILTGDSARPDGCPDAPAPCVIYEPFLHTGIYGEPLPPVVLPGDPIQPAASYQLRYWAGIFGMANLTSTLDQTLDFASRTRIAIAGSPQDPTINPDPDGDGTPMPIVTFTDPVTHFEYRSAQRDGENASVGWRMLDDARTFAEGEWTDAQQALETAQAAGTPDEVRAAEIAVDRANATLNEKVQMIDFMVNIGNVFSSAG